MEKIYSTKDYIEVKNNQLVVTAKKLDIYVPKFYKERGLLNIGETAECLAIFRLVFNNEFYTDTLLLNNINIEFIDYREEKIDDYEYIVLELQQNSVFARNIHIIKDSNVLYTIYTSFIGLGKLPPFITYDKVHRLFDNTKRHAGMNLNVDDHSVFEMIYAHIFRSKKDPFLPYRKTDYSEPYVIVPIAQVSHGPISASARTSSGYLSEGITSILVKDNPAPSIVENLLRV